MSYTHVACALVTIQHSSEIKLRFSLFLQPFTYCTIGVAAHANIVTAGRSEDPAESKSSQDSPRGMFPSILERKSFLPHIVSQVRIYHK